jgi:hypothetical protein
MFSYNPYQYRCCQHNVAFAWPYFAEHLFMATPGNGLAAVFYAPASVTAQAGKGTRVQIREETKYPFDGRVSFTFSAAGGAVFPFAFRIPGWSGTPSVFLNNSPISVQKAGRGWLIIKRSWHTGDRLAVNFPMHITATVWAKNHGAVSISRGPLSYSLKIAEKWEQYGDQKWAAYQVFPGSAWNYGLVVDPGNPDKTIRVARTSSRLAGQPFALDAAPIELKARAKRVSGWNQEKNGMVGRLPEKPVVNGPSEEITLVPMGCARLRISAFPAVQ